jgi:predicted anti-sigma-YlaC factor YlaD
MVKPLMDLVVGSCETTRAQLSEHLEGELTGVRRLRLRLHLAGCTACSAVACGLAETIEWLQRLGGSFTPEPAPSIVPDLVERIHRAERE